MSWVLALLSCAFGVLAAYYWYRSAAVAVMPTWAKVGRMEPVIRSHAQDGWIVGAVTAIHDAGRWSKWGAIWSAITVLLSALSSLASAMGY